nr:MAG: hypothetical protein TU35_09525 [Thermoproteus sp. AZ2]
MWEAAPVGLLAKMREGGLEIGGERLDYPAVVRHIKGAQIDAAFKAVFHTIYPIRGVDYEKGQGRRDRLQAL